jgi:phosphatidate cytidylyltransferase
MREPRQVTASSTRAHVLVGVLLASGALTTLLVGRLALAIFVGVALLAAYGDLRRLLGEVGHPTTLVLGAAGVAGFLWCGYNGELDLVPAVAAGLVLALLVTRIVLHEAGSRSTEVTADLAATLGAAGLVGILGGHVLLIRAVPRFGFRGVVAFGLAVLGHESVSFVVGRWRGRHPLNRLIAPQKTWEGALAGFAASVVAGIGAGIFLDPPFSISSGPLFGIAMGVVVPLGDLGFSAIKRSAGARHSGAYLGAAGGALDVVNGILFAAPVFYWGFRTIAL